MDKYKKIYEILEINPLLVDIVYNKIELPYPTAHQPAEPLFEFPPALIPLWSDTSMHYIAYWKHWFNQREKTIIRKFAESKYVVEISRNPAQLFYNVIVDSISTEDDVTEECRSFAKKLGINDEIIKQIDEYTLEHGAFLSSLLDMDELKDTAPLSCFEDSELYRYKLDFPHHKMVLNEEIMQNICGFECNEKLLQRIKNEKNSPLWFQSTNQFANFKKLLEQDDFNGAWMCLNTSEWIIGDMKKALSQLAEKAGNKNFEALAEAWISLDFWDDEEI